MGGIFSRFPRIMRAYAREKRTNCCIVIQHSDTDWAKEAYSHRFCRLSAGCCAGKHRLGNAKISDNQSDLHNPCLNTGSPLREHHFRFVQRTETIVDQWFSSVNRWFSVVNQWFSSVNRWFRIVNQWFSGVNRWFRKEKNCTVWKRSAFRLCAALPSLARERRGSA